MKSDRVEPGRITWCETARSNIQSQFSDKTSRPVLVTAYFGMDAAVYPCSSICEGPHAGEWVGDFFGSGDTYVIHAYGLFYVPFSDLQLPGIIWKEWEVYSRVHALALQEDLRRFRHQNRHRTGAVREESRQQDTSMTTRLADRMPPELLRRYSEAPSPPPRPAAPSPPPVKKLSAREEFEKALADIQPYHILKPDEEPPPPPRKKGRI